MGHNSSRSFSEQLDTNNLIKEILKLDKDRRFFFWLYLPINFVSIQDAIEFRDKYDIPDTIIVRKIISNLIYNDFDLQKVTDYLVEHKIMDDKDIVQIGFLFDECKKLKLNEFDPVKANRIITLTKKFDANSSKAYEKKAHKGYPLPDPEKGRPEIGWRECYHENCHKYFENGWELKQHLEHLDKHTWGFHKFHENVVEEMGLTPQKVKDINLTKCPSVVCDKHSKKFTPDELIQHFQLLGIKPFWEPGMVVKNSQEDDSITFENLTYKEVFTNDECVVCLENPPGVIFLPCFHHTVCLNCIESINRCPMCRNPLKTVIPF